MSGRANLGGIDVGEGLGVRVMGVLNVSAESFYRGSVVADESDLIRRAEAMVEAGAAWVDVGALSTSPAASAEVPANLEAERLGRAVEVLVGAVDVPVSADAARSEPVRAALQAGARVVNDITGLMGDPGVAPLVAAAGAGLVLMASAREAPVPEGDPVAAVRGRLAAGLAVAARAGIDPSSIVLDPGIGFFRKQAMAWYEWDVSVLARLPEIEALGHPVCVGVSRKSFVGALASEPDPARRLAGSLAATALAVAGGARVIRTHDVAETVQAVKVAEAVRCAARGGRAC